MMTNGSPGFLTGLAAEARIARALGWAVEIGGGTAEGARRAARRLIAAGASAIVSFGLAGGLDPTLPAGTVVVADAVLGGGRVWRTDATLSARLGGGTGHLCLALDRIAATAAEKQRLGAETGAAAGDIESGVAAAVASAAGMPFGVLRAICDPADRDLPPAALVALNAAGAVGPARVTLSILRHPGQIGALIGLARDAALAQRALADRLRRIEQETPL
jgi:adenosylhomocysteine nucleosidase